MNNITMNSDQTIKSSGRRYLLQVRRSLLNVAILAMCTALLQPGLAMAKKRSGGSVSCTIFPASIYTGFPFELKIVRNPSYPGSWSAPLVNAKAVFTATNGGKIATTFSETESRYPFGTTTVFATLLAPSSDVVDTSVNAVITAEVIEIINSGKKTQKTKCKRVTAFVNESN